MGVVHFAMESNSTSSARIPFRDPSYASLTTLIHVYNESCHQGGCSMALEYNLN